ncbi:hypothetical protein GCM10022222_52490 [Amycolatopsis ultiminotia]|uniref:Uncharacterized protein n=1 Tax=Amycolatopsis ultiminotia TaxID=543629 RepID=A0ABP6XC37_9PSEU
MNVVAALVPHRGAARRDDGRGICCTRPEDLLDEVARLGRFVPAAFGRTPLAQVLGTGCYDVERAQQAPVFIGGGLAAIGADGMPLQHTRHRRSVPGAGTALPHVH